MNTNVNYLGAQNGQRVSETTRGRTVAYQRVHRPAGSGWCARLMSGWVDMHPAPWHTRESIDLQEPMVCSFDVWFGRLGTYASGYTGNIYKSSLNGMVKCIMYLHTLFFGKTIALNELSRWHTFFYGKMYHVFVYLFSLSSTLQSDLEE